MGLLSANMLAELAKDSPDVLRLLKVTWPGPSLKRYAGTAYSSASGGFYEPRVVAWGSLRRAVSMRDGGLEAVQTEVTLLDDDREIEKIVEGPSAYGIKGSAAVIELAGHKLAAADWFTYASLVIEHVERMKGRCWRLMLRPDDIALRSEVPKHLIKADDWPNAHSSALEQRVPILAGVFDSRNVVGNASVEGKGAVPGHYVDTTTNAWRVLWCAGRALYVPAVFKNGTAVTATTQYFEKNGRLYTTSVLAADPGANPTFTADIYGYESSGLGTGSFVVNPAKLLRLGLNNFFLRDYLRGAFSGDHALIDTASFDATETYCDNQRYRGSFYISDKTTGLDFIRSVCESFRLSCYWTNLGKLAIKVSDPTLPTIYYNDSRLITSAAQREWLDADVVPMRSGANVFDRLIIDFGQQPAQAVKSTLEVRDTAMTEESVQQIATSCIEVKIDVDRLLGGPRIGATGRFKAAMIRDVAPDGTVDRWADFSGANRDLTQGTAANRPRLRLNENGINWMPALEFGFSGGSHRLVSAVAMSQFLTAADGCVIMLAKLTGAFTNDATPSENTAAWCEDNGSIGLHLKTGPVTVALNDDGAVDTVQLAEDSAAKLYIWRHSGGTLYVSNNMGASWSSIASGNTANLTGVFVVGSNRQPAATPRFLQGLIAELITLAYDPWNSATPRPDIQHDVLEYFKDEYGL